MNVGFTGTMSWHLTAFVDCQNRARILIADVSLMPIVLKSMIIDPFLSKWALCTQ